MAGRMSAAGLQTPEMKRWLKGQLGSLGTTALPGEGLQSPSLSQPGFPQRTVPLISEE